MKTVIEYIDGGREVIDGHYPVFDLALMDDEDRIQPNVCLADEEGFITRDEVPLRLVRRVTYEVAP